MNTTYTFVERAPTLSEYRALCAAVGWEHAINFEAAVTSLSNSLYAVIVLCDGEPSGMGRIVGDGAIYFYLQDVAVHPAHQGQGVGRQIVAYLMRWLDGHAPPKAFVGLFAAQGKEAFYQHFGFDSYPALNGMFTVMPPTADRDTIFQNTETYPTAGQA